MKLDTMAIDRRGFLLGAAATVGVTSPLGFACVSTPAGSDRMLFGTTRSKPEDVRLMKSIGYDFYEQSALDAFCPEKDEEWWKRRRDELLAMPLPLRSCNGFIPRTCRLTGPDADFESALRLAETMLRRADEIGVVSMVFGDAGARNVPGDYTLGRERRPNVEAGVRQYTEFCRQLARRMSDLRHVRIAIEPLRPNESNIINYVWQGRQICEAVDSPHICLMADIFHMMMGQESADSIRQAGSRLIHCHIAEYGTRRFPGSDPATVDRFQPYFRALADIGYVGGISCECGFGKPEDLARNLETALQTLRG